MTSIKSLILSKITDARKDIEIELFDSLDLPVIESSFVDPITHDFSNLNISELNDAYVYLTSLTKEFEKLEKEKRIKLFFLSKIFLISMKIISEVNNVGKSLEDDIDSELDHVISTKKNLNARLGGKCFNCFSVKVLINSNVDYIHCFKVNHQDDEFLKEFINNGIKLKNVISLMHSLEIGMAEDNFIVVAPSQIDISRLRSFFYFSFVLSGGCLIDSKVVKHSMSSTFNDLEPYYDFSVDYKQFYETIGILEDSNSEEFVLDRFLKIYQVIENFTYRSSLSELVNRRTGGDRFTIRKFRSLYKQIDVNESKALVKFIDKIVRDSYQPLASRTSSLKSKLKNEVNALGLRKLDNICIFLGNDFAKDHTSLLKKFDSSEGIAFVVYFLRNSIVHNKETEVHISNSTIQNVCNEIYEFVEVISNFLFYCIQFIFRYKNDLVKYSDDSITLYDSAEVI